MRKVILLEHVSLDGYLAGPKGEMDWIRVDDELWDYVEPLIDTADSAIYGRVTFEMMAAYWPTAAEQPGATPHDIHHSRWVNAATKVAFSNSMTKTSWRNTRLVKGDPAEAMAKLKREPGENFVLIGSASLAQSFIRLGLIDEYRLTVNPVILGGGTPLFKESGRSDLRLVGNKALASGVVALHYEKA